MPLPSEKGQIIGCSAGNTETTKRPALHDFAHGFKKQILQAGEIFSYEQSVAEGSMSVSGIRMSRVKLRRPAITTIFFSPAPSWRLLQLATSLIGPRSTEARCKTLSSI